MFRFVVAIVAVLFTVGCGDEITKNFYITAPQKSEVPQPLPNPTTPTPSNPATPSVPETPTVPTGPSDDVPTPVVVVPPVVEPTIPPVQPPTYPVDQPNFGDCKPGKGPKDGQGQGDERACK